MSVHYVMKIYREYGVKLHAFCTSAIIKNEFKVKKKING